MTSLVLLVRFRAMKIRTLSVEERGMIVGMRTAGMSTHRIAAELEMTQSTVFTVWKNFQERGTLQPLKSSGRPQKLNARDKRVLGRILCKNRRLPLAAIREKMHVKVSPTTLRKAMKSIGFSNRAAAKKPFLSEKHKARRLAFAKEHRHWTTFDWKNVIWTDESSFETGKKSRPVKVWRQLHERFSLDCLAPSFKSGRSSVMVWGAFSDFDKCPLVIIPPDRRKGRDFVDVVYESRLSGFYFLHDHRETLILMEDGAPVHRSKEASEWRQAHGMRKLLWPANSPDLNPIENLWKIVKDTIQKEELPRNKEELVNTIHRAWEEVSLEMIEVLLASMPHRMKAVIKANGGSTRW